MNLKLLKAKNIEFVAGITAPIDLLKISDEQLDRLMADVLKAETLMRNRILARKLGLVK